jgi:CRP-like cAMP-binding protein
MQTLRTLIYHFSNETFSRKEVILHENETAKNFYIVKSGQVILSKVFELDQKNIYLTNRLKKRCNVAEIGPGEIFGEIECIMNDKSHF